MQKILVLLLTLVMVAIAGETNFSGTWKVNTDKTKMPDFGGPGGGRGARSFGNLVVAQDGNKIVITRSFPGMNGEMREQKTEMEIGGEQVVEKNERGETYSRASWVGDKLKIEEKRYFETPNGDFEMSSEQVWTLQAEGKELFIKSSMHSQRGDFEMEMFYSKE